MPVMPPSDGRHGRSSQYQIHAERILRMKQQLNKILAVKNWILSSATAMIYDGQEGLIWFGDKWWNKLLNNLY